MIRNSISDVFFFLPEVLFCCFFSWKNIHISHSFDFKTREINLGGTSKTQFSLNHPILCQKLNKDNLFLGKKRYLCCCWSNYITIFRGRNFYDTKRKRKYFMTTKKCNVFLLISHTLWYTTSTRSRDLHDKKWDALV